jgi:3-oxoacyl-[acyl-carrier-protein] synthase-1
VVEVFLVTAPVTSGGCGSATPCAIAAVGLVTALGNGVPATWPRLIGGDGSHLSVRDDLTPNRPLLVGAVTGPLPPVPERLRRHGCRNNALAGAAIDQIESEIRAAIHRVGPSRVGVVMGSSTSGIAAAEDAMRARRRSGRFPPGFDYVQTEHGGLAEFVAACIGATGPAYTVSTACSSGAKAVATARGLLALGLCDAVVAGGADSLCRLTANGFSALQAVSDRPCNPFSANRRGLTLGEGAAVFLVTAETGGIQLAGTGEASDAHHMSAPDPDGTGAETAMRAALADAGAAPEDVAYLNLHGTATPLNDSMEALAVARVLRDVPCSSTKPLTGHALGAAGAIELAFCWAVLRERDGQTLAVPPHRWDGVEDPALPRLHLVTPGESVTAGERSVVLSNSFGFGGNNVCLALRRGPA